MRPADLPTSICAVDHPTVQVLSDLSWILESKNYVCTHVVAEISFTKKMPKWYLVGGSFCTTSLQAWFHVVVKTRVLQYADANVTSLHAKLASLLVCTDSDPDVCIWVGC